MANQNKFFDLDRKYMRQALELANEGLGRVAPNPSVGCVVVKDNVILGAGRTQDGGRPHAEAYVLANISEDIAGATAYVTLEPCSHYGQTPPCAKALIDAGVERVVVACIDSDERVAGKGIQMLLDAGITVDCGLYESEALKINAGFFLKIHSSRPWVTLKMAISSDGKIADANGAPVQISCKKSQIHMHQNLRATHDGIMVGVNTIMSDDPALTTRYLPAGKAHNTVRFILGDTGSVSSMASIYSNESDSETVNIANKNLLEALEVCANEYGVTRLLVEGGRAVMDSFLESGIWDELWLYHSPNSIGDNGLDSPDFNLSHKKKLQTIEIGVDRLDIYSPQD